MSTASFESMHAKRRDAVRGTRKQTIATKFKEVRIAVAQKAAVSANSTQVRKLSVRLASCKLRPRFRYGMTLQEARDEMDRAIKEFLDCLRKKAKR